jgi:anti-sigma-K factor RskA
MNLLAHPELVERLAAAYALGTLRGGARRRFEAMARQSPSVRAQVIIWQERFAAMTELQPAETPSPNVWKRIENLLPAQPGTQPAVREPVLLERLSRLLALWRGVALATGVAAIVVSVVGAQLSAQLKAMPEIQYVAVLADERQAPMLLATVDPKHKTLTLKRVAAVQPGPDRSLQLWALPRGAAPRSLGVLGDETVIRLSMPPMPMNEVPALAVSLEPRGGAPQGSGPTGPVMYQGALLQTTL